ncbi:MAG: RNA methyltransferase [Acidimicrobiia bacterium]|nr:RNA methyltransferase [Acidimicrobiia bacterium]
MASAVRLRRARGRADAQSTLLEGPHLLEAAAAVGALVGPVFALQEDHTTASLAAGAGYELVVVTQQVLDRLAPTRHPRGPVGVVRIPSSVPVRDRNVVVLWGVGDPGNAGTLIRTAAAFGFGVTFGPGTVDPWSPKVLRAGAGAHFSIPIESGLSDLADLRRRGFDTIATVVAGGTSPSELGGTGPWAVIVGDEAGGLPDDLVAVCDQRATIRMSAGQESLNASVAGSIMMYELAGRSGLHGPLHD